MDKWMLVEYVINIVDVFLIFYFVKVLLCKDGVSFKKILLIVMVQALINSFINNTFGIASLVGLTFMITSFGIIFHMVMKIELFVIYLPIILGLIVNFIIEMLVISLIIFVPNISPESLYTFTINRILAVILAKSLFFLVIKYWISKIKIDKFLSSIRLYQLYLLFIPNIILIFLAFWFYKYVHAFNIPFKLYIIILTFAIMLFSMGLFQIMRKIIEHTKKEIEWKEKEEEFRVQAFYLSNIQQLLEAFKAQRHDFNHHLGCIYGLSKLEKFDEMKSYIENLTNDVSDFNTIVSAKNPVLTSLLNIKAVKAKNDDIPVNFSIDITDEITTKAVDLSSIIGNLLDNAIEACTKVDKESRNIDVELYSKNENLIIKIANTKVNNINDNKILKTKYTSKSDADNHGFGLLNIRKTIEKYNGFIKIEDEEKSFKVSIALPQRQGNVL